MTTRPPGRSSLPPALRESDLGMDPGSTDAVTVASAHVTSGLCGPVPRSLHAHLGASASCAAPDQPALPPHDSHTAPTRTPRDVRHLEDSGEDAIVEAARWLEIPPSSVRAAVDYSAEFTDEVDEDLARRKQAAEAAREQWLIRGHVRRQAEPRSHRKAADPETKDDPWM